MNTAHGKNYILVEGNIINCKPVGAFNLEGIVKVIEDLEVVIKSFGDKKFKMLFDYSEAEGGTPEVYEEINDFNAWLNSQNMVAKALITQPCTQFDIFEHRTPARKLQNAKVFTDKTSATTWLKLQ